MNLNLRILAAVGSLSLVALAIASCDRSEPRVLPEGEQQVSGVLESIPLSATRRGTHVLEIDGEAFSFVESATMSLSDFEGLRVTVTGTFEENIDTDLLPVLIATDVRLKALALTQKSFPAMRLTISIPDEWTMEETEEGVRFSASGSLKPVLTIRKLTLEEWPTGTSLAVGGEKAVSIPTGSGETVIVAAGNEAISFAYEPYGSEEQRRELRYIFRRVVLHSVTFGQSVSSRPTTSGAVTTGSGPVLGQPCGGDAGILCPAGSYCEITDQVNGIGHCKTVR